MNITGPFRALIATAKSFNDPRQVIKDVLPRPLEDVPGITTEVRRLEENQQQTQTPPTGRSMSPRHPRRSERDDEAKPSSRPGLLAAALLAAPLSSCISVKAPDKPIDINLNVTIKQEVLVRLQRDVEQLINQNPQAFPQQPREEAVMRAVASGCGAYSSAAPASAQTPAVNAARAAGAVGERYDGYIGVAAPVTAAVRSQVARINIQRRALYSNFAASRRASARRTSASPPAASCSRGWAWAKLIC